MLLVSPLANTTASAFARVNIRFDLIFYLVRSVPYWTLLTWTEYIPLVEYYLSGSTYSSGILDPL